MRAVQGGQIHAKAGGCPDETGAADMHFMDSGDSLVAGDALATQDQATLTVRATEDAELLLFDMA